MTNQDLVKFLQRFPQTAPVRIKLAGDRVTDIVGVEMGFNREPLRLEAQNLNWSEMMQDKIEAVLVPNGDLDDTHHIAREAPKSIRVENKP